MVSDHHFKHIEDDDGVLFEDVDIEEGAKVSKVNTKETKEEREKKALKILEVEEEANGGVNWRQQFAELAFGEKYPETWTRG